MITLPGKSIYLRALEPNDLDFVYDIENDQSIWHVSNTNTPYSKFLIKQYLANAQQDIFEVKQLRLAICLNATFKAIGLIDLFDFDPNHSRAGIGIVIANQQMRNLNFGTEALEVLIHYCFTNLQLHQLYANIATINANSIALFTKFKFQLVGIKKEWMYLNNSYQDEAFFQLINPRQ